jgi:FAD/FMN-containing dehydrogenase
MLISGWGNYPKITTTIRKPNSEQKLFTLLSSSKTTIGRGLGRSYGDSSLNSSLIVSSECLNFMVSFDEQTGTLVAFSGVTLEEILDIFVPRGWFLPVVPGTKFITLGGAVASDVHGKNHHLSGSFSSHISWIDIWTSKEGLVRCSPNQNEDLFWSTVGGHGLTGFILAAAIRLIRIPSAYITQTMFKAASLSEIMEIFEDNQHKQMYTVAWIDCLKTGHNMGRAIFMEGRWFDNLQTDLPIKKSISNNLFCKNSNHFQISVPFTFPSFILNKYSIKLFNYIYYTFKNTSQSKSIIYYDKFFFPLDSIKLWNRIYGRSGFIQYQIVIPLENSKYGLPAIFKQIVDIGAGSFLAVLKLFGQQPFIKNNISFPLLGYTLALDFPNNEKINKMLNVLDNLVMDYNGRHYLTKDSRLSPIIFKKTYGNSLDNFLKIKQIWDPVERFRSIQSDRLGLTGRN